jgi:protein required for attachment to host cells
MKTWVAVINRCEARLFEINEKPVITNGRNHDRLKPVKKLENPKGRLRNREINADRPGFSRSRFAFSGTHRVKSQEPTDRIAEMFAKDISTELEKAFNGHLFANLILVGEPHFLGKVRAALSKNTLNAISNTLRKDLVNVPDHDLPDFLWPQERELRSNF